MIRPVNMTIGSDPEAFLMQNGRIIGSERAIKYPLKTAAGHEAVVKDGVQIELHPLPSGSPSLLVGSLSSCFKVLRSHLDSNYPGIRVAFDEVVEVDQDEFNALSHDARILGCQPSKNFYGLKPENIDREKYRTRAAGGHLHLGLWGLPGIYNKTDNELVNLVPLLDIFVGNTGVLLDRDKGQVERRRMYGQAGQYRLPKHGLEYRVLSNFWLRHSSLVDLMYGMSKLAVSIMYHTLNGEVDYIGQLRDLVDIKQVVKAIQENDWDLAKKNFNAIRPFLVRNMPDAGYPITIPLIHKFDKMCDMARDKGIESVFAEAPFDHWTRGDVMKSFVEVLYRL